MIDKKQIKILAMYLPQYYEFEQNDKWWGKGFTEWTNVKNAKPLFNGHRQPRVPLNGYYCLLNKEDIKAQAELANKYNIYGWCIYHYWFEGTQMMQYPPEILRDNPDIDIHYCFSWANHTWTKAPGKKDEKVLIRQTYGNEADWIRHYRYLETFFKDSRYIKIDNKPVLVIYNAIDIKCWNEMRALWEKLAKESGFDGIYYVNTLKTDKDVDTSVSMKFNAQFEYQPTFGVRRSNKLNYGFWYHFKYNVLNLKIHNHITKFNYDNVWHSIQKRQNISNGIKTFLGAFNDWDTSIRWGHKGNVTVNSSPGKFKTYLTQQIRKSATMESEYIFLTAWNEWSEGAYIEPDKDFKYQFLEAVRDAFSESCK